VVNIPVEQDHRNSGSLGLEHGLRERLFRSRCEKDQVDLLRDHRIDIRNLLRLGATGIGINQLIATRFSFALHTLGLRGPPWVIHFHLGKPDFIGVLLLKGRRCRVHRTRECGANHK
jgi:hypothetical protein